MSQNYNHPPYAFYAVDILITVDAVKGLFEELRRSAGVNSETTRLLVQCRSRYFNRIVHHLCNTAFNKQLGTEVTKMLGLTEEGCPIEEFLTYYELSLTDYNALQAIRRVREDWLPFLDDLPGSDAVRDTMVKPVVEDQIGLMRKGVKPFYRLKPRDESSYFVEVYLDYRIVCWDLKNRG